MNAVRHGLRCKRLLATIVVQIIILLTIVPGIAAACEGGGGLLEGVFLLEVSPTVLTKPKHKATVTVLGNAFEEGTAKIEAKGTNLSEFVYNAAKCEKKYAKSENCPFEVNYLGGKAAEIKFVARNIEGVGSNTVTITATPPLEAIPSELAFGSVTTKTESHKSVKVKALETVNLATAAIKGTGAGAYKIASDACSGTKLEAKKECTIEVGFLPTEKISFNANLEVPFEVVSSKETGTSLVVPLSGKGI
jgi:hypothetical protein